MATHSARLRAQEGPTAFPKDGELLSQLAKGEAEAFEPVLMRHGPGVLRYLRLAWAGGLESAKIASAVFGDTFRLYCPESGECPPEPPEDFGLDMLALARKRASSVHASPDAAAGKLAELHAEAREALVLRHIVLTGYAGVARVTGESADGIANRLASARRELAKLLSPDGSLDEHPSIWCMQSLGLEDAPPESLAVSLTRLLDGEASEVESERTENHIKECSSCRRLLAALRGADRYAAHIVSSVDGTDRVIEDVSGALGLRSGAVQLGRLRVPRAVVWTGVAAASLMAGALVVMALNAIAGSGRDLRPVDLRLAAPEDGAFPPRWTVRRPGASVSAPAETGSRLAAGLEVALLSSGGHGVIAWPEGAKLYAESGSRLRIARDATTASGLAIERGRAFLMAPSDSSALALAVGGIVLGFESGETRALLEHVNDSVSVSVLAGKALVRLGEEELTVPAGRRLRVIGGRQAALERIDYRVFAMGFMPPGERPSAWPAAGGSAARSGNSPFRFISPPARRPDLDGATSVSAIVLGPDGTAFFVTGPNPVRVAAVRDSRVRYSGELPGVVGDPAVGPTGEVFLVLRDGSVAALSSEVDHSPRTVVPPASGESPRSGPVVSHDGRIYVSYASGVTVFGPDGKRLWRQQRVGSGGPVSLAPGAAFVATLDGRLHALSKPDGRIIASVGGDTGAIVSHVAVSPDGTAYAVSAGGTLLWLGEDGASAQVSLPAGEYPFAPAIGLEGRVVVASADGSLYSLPRRPTAPPGSAFFTAGEPLAQGPVIDASGAALVLTDAGSLIAVEPTGRSRSWDLDARRASPLAITRNGGVVFGTRAGRLFASQFAE